jgi:hypothetical protein
MGVDRVVESASADTVAGFEYDDVDPVRVEMACRSDTGEAGAHHDDLRLRRAARRR